MAYEASPREGSDRRTGARFEDNYSRGRNRDYGQDYREEGGYSEKRAPRDYPEEAPRARRPRDYPEERPGRDRYGPPQRYEDRRPRGGSFRYREDFNDRGGSRGGFNRRSGYDRYDSGRGRGFNNRGFRRGGTDRGPRRDRTPPEPNRVLGVFGLSPRTEERDLYEVFSEFGRVDDIQMVYDSLTGRPNDDHSHGQKGRSRGFGFIYFEDIDSAIAAREGLARGLELHGRVVRIDYSKTESAHTPTPGVFMGRYRDGNSSYNRGFGRGGGGSFSRPFNRPGYAPRGRYGGGGGYRSGSRSRSRSYSLSPPRNSGGHRSNARGASPAGRMRTQSSSRSRSPPPPLSESGVGASSRRRSDRGALPEAASNNYVDHVNGGSGLNNNGAHGGGNWSDAGSASPM